MRLWSVDLVNIKGGARRIEKSHKVWMMMMIAASLVWAGAAETPEQSKLTLENNKVIQNNSLGSLSSQTKSNQNQIKNAEVKKIGY